MDAVIVMTLADVGPVGDVDSTIRAVAEFEPTAGNSGPMSGATIQNGAYHVPAKKGPAVGANLIEIRAKRKTGRKVPARPPMTGEEDEIVEVIPPKYNEASTLRREVTPGENVIDFNLDSS